MVLAQRGRLPIIDRDFKRRLRASKDQITIAKGRRRPLTRRGAEHFDPFIEGYRRWCLREHQGFHKPVQKAV